MPDYQRLIDPETWAFIKDTERYYPADTASQPISEQRRIYDRMCRAFFQGYPDGVRASDLTARMVPVRIYETDKTAHGPGATVVYFHGGGHMVGGLDSHDDICAEICDRTGFRVVSADYRLAPEFKHPAMFEDARAATEFVMSTFEGDLLLCGDSAGGNLAAAVAHDLRGKTDRIKGQVLIYPGLGGDKTKGSFQTHAQAPMLTVDEIAFYAKSRHPGGECGGDPTFEPLHDVTFEGLPPTLIVTAQCDPQSDDGRDYRDAILAAGGHAVWVEEPGLVHGFLRARTTVNRARISFDRVIDTLRAMGAGAWTAGQGR